MERQSRLMAKNCRAELLQAKHNNFTTLTCEHHPTNRTGWLRTAVLGATDRSLSTARFIVGVAAAHAERDRTTIPGVSGVFVGNVNHRRRVCIRLLPIGCRAGRSGARAGGTSHTRRTASTCATSSVFRHRRLLDPFKLPSHLRPHSLLVLRLVVVLLAPVQPLSSASYRAPQQSSWERSALPLQGAPVRTVVSAKYLGTT